MQLQIKITIFLFFVALCAQAEAVVLSDKTEVASLSGECLYLCDSSRFTTVWDIVAKSKDKFIRTDSPDSLLGKSIWYRYDFVNTSQSDRSFFLSLGQIKKARIMLYAGRSQFVFKNGGYSVSKTFLLQSEVFVPLDIPKEWQQFSMYIYVDPDDVNSLDALKCKLVAQSQAISHYISHALVIGVLLGFITILLMYHVFTYLFLRDRTYLSFSGYLVVLWGLMAQDFYILPLSNYPKVLGFVMIVTNVLAPYFYASFSRLITDVDVFSPRTDIQLVWYKRLLLVFGGIILLLSLCGVNLLMLTMVLNIGLGVFYIAAIYLHVGLFKIKRRAVRFFLSGSVVLLVSLTVGVCLMTLTDWGFVGILILISGIATQLLLFSISLSDKYRQTQVEKVEAQTELICQLEENQQLQLQLTSELEEKVRERTQEVVAQKQEIEEKNKQILSSIDYAKLIQQAMLPAVDEMQRSMPEHFILYKPRDIVSGDFYWVKELELDHGDPVLIIAAADCTGHGVPGGFISMLGMSLLNEIVSKFENSQSISAAAILEEMRRQLKQRLKHGWQSTSRDGMDIALCVFHRQTSQLEFAGANLPLILIRSGEIQHFKPTRNPIGIHPVELPFENQTIDLHAGDCLYLFSDGFIDQFGGLQYKRFSTSKFKALLCEVHPLPIPEQRIELDRQLSAWKMDNEQIDDIMIIGMKI